MSEGEGGVSVTGHGRSFEFHNGIWEVSGVEIENIGIELGFQRKVLSLVLNVLILRHL